MSKQRAALQKVAKKNGVFVNEIRKEIETALATAMKSTDPGVQAYWESIPHKGTKPTPEEVILYIAKQIKESKALRRLCINIKILYEREKHRRVLF